MGYIFDPELYIFNDFCIIQTVVLNNEHYITNAAYWLCSHDDCQYKLPVNVFPKYCLLPL